MLLSDHVETIQALPKCRKVLYHAPIRSRGNYSSLTQMQKSIVPCSYHETHVETIQALPKCRKVLYHAPIRSRGNYSALPKCRKVLYHAPIRSRGNYSSLTQMQKSIVPCSYQITWKLFKPYPNVEKYCTMLLSDHVETIQALPKCRKVLYHAPIRSRGNYSSLTQMQKSIVPCSYQITWKLFSLTQMQKSIVPFLSDHVEIFKPTQMQKSIVPCSYQITWKLFSLTQMQKSIVPCSYQITWKLFSLTQMQKSIVP